jgi:hypothetical protein
MATRRQFSREFKLEAVKLVKERGATLAQASRDLEVHQTVLPRRRGLPKDFGARSEIADNVLDRQFKARCAGTRNWWPTSPTSGRPKAGCMQPLCSICIQGGL